MYDFSKIVFLKGVLFTVLDIGWPAILDIEVRATVGSLDSGYVASE